jgi:hypothetical protein
MIEVMAEDAGQFTMLWNPSGFNPLFSNDSGIWEDPGGAFTWCEANGYGPTHWRTLPTPLMAGRTGDV